MTTQTPTRRSKRFQPTVSISGPSRLDHGHQWIGYLDKRPTTREDLHDPEDFTEGALCSFYSGFSRPSSSTRGAASKQGKGKDTVETYRIGDTVLIYNDQKASNVAVIVALWEMTDDEEDDTILNARVQWFLRPKQLASVRVQKSYLPNEIYYSLSSTEVIPLRSITSHCQITSTPPTSTSSGSKKILQKSAHYSGNIFFCNQAIDAQRGLYYKLNWSAHVREALASHDKTTGSPWYIRVASPTKMPVTPTKNIKTGRPKGSGRKPKATHQSDDSEHHGQNKDDEDEDMERKNVDEEDSRSEGDSYKPEHEPSHSDASSEHDPIEEGEGEVDEEHDDSALRTPSRRRLSSHLTPQAKRKRGLAEPTPHSKAALRKRARKMKIPVVTPMQSFGYGNSTTEVDEASGDPWTRAMGSLHVGSRPEVLPCREEEFTRILSSVENLLEEGSGGCVYISGVPGTGKTATVHAMVRELKRLAEINEVNPFSYVEINGLRIPEPSAAYTLLWEGVSAHDVEADGRLKMSSKEALKRLTKHFGRGARSGPEGHACIVLMDELDQLMTVKQDVVYNFFNWPTLVESKLIVIAVANTMDLPERVMSGRVRSRLGMVRINFQPYTTPQLEKIVHARLKLSIGKTDASLPQVLAPDAVKFAAMKVSSISGDARRVLDICRRAVELARSSSRPASTNDIQQVIKAMQNSPTATFVRECSLHERIMLASLLKCARRAGTEEVVWSEVQHQHIIYANILPGDDESTRKPTPSELLMVLDSLLASHALLIEDGASAARKPEGQRRLLLNVEQNEVERVLGEVGGQRWKNAITV